MQKLMNFNVDVVNMRYFWVSLWICYLSPVDELHGGIVVHSVDLQERIRFTEKVLGNIQKHSASADRDVAAQKRSLHFSTAGNAF